MSLPDNLISICSTAFERTYSLTRIEYCGKLTSFPITPTCPPERQALIDAAKTAAAKVIADKAVADKAVAVVKKTTITCVKGKLVKKVTGDKPKCPSGYKKK
jgi:hypothetical protein